jgi:thiosulfate dehydrogenase [quinone] large subunit
MIEKLVQTRTINPSAEPVSEAGTLPAAAGLGDAQQSHRRTDMRMLEQPSARLRLEFSLAVYTMQLILAYEWLLSGIDKLANPHFGTELPAVLRGSTLVNPYGWYTAFLKQFVLPHAALLAPAVVLGELAIGAVLILSGVLRMWRPFARPTVYAGWAACLALIGSVLLALNYSFQQGTPLPWVNAAQAFSPGVGIDMMVASLSVALLAANLRAVLLSSSYLRTGRSRGRGRAYWAS